MESNPKPLPQARNLAVKVLRERRGLRQNELMGKAGLSKSAMTHLESGRLAVAPRTLAKIGGALRYERDEIDWLTLALGVFTGDPDLPASAAGLSPETRREIGTEAARRIRLGLASTLEQLIAEAQARRHAEERKEAARLYRELAPLPLLRQEALVLERAELQTWAMVERLCEESEKAASDEPKRALVLANLALRCAQSRGIPRGLRPRLEGFAWAFLANARRVASDLPAAQEAFALAWTSWRKGKKAGAAVPLGTWRLYDLEASLRREQFNLRQALLVVGKALKCAPATAHGKLLLKKAAIYIVMDRPHSAILALREAESFVSRAQEPALYFALQFNLGVVLELAGHIDRAKALLPELRTTATALRSEVGLVRVAWLQARIQARMGESAQAILGLEQVLREFAHWKLAHDAAQAALELAVLLLQDGQVGRVKVLANETLWIFRAQRVEPRVLAALRVFCDAAAKETVTIAAAQATLRQLHEARFLRP